MNPDVATGIFGKLPAHGDFIHRNLSTKVINVWDGWLQTFVGSTQERLADAWLDVYLTSPIWRFCLSEGVVDEHRWAGIVLPSVDRVGRYFPFSVMRKLSADAIPTDFINAQQNWFQAIEYAALRALDGQIQTERLIEELNQLQPESNSSYRRQRGAHLDAGVVVDMDLQGSSGLTTMPYFLDAFVSATFNSYSVWSTAGSDRVEPCLFVTPGMPPASGGAAMMDGLWEHWEWSVPVRPLPMSRQPEVQDEPGMAPPTWRPSY